MPDIFLSYSREDHVTARRFAEALQRAGFDVWWDQTLRSGEAYDEVTEQALRAASAVVVLWSRHSVASRWVRAEATIADRRRTLVPAMIDACDRPVMFELTQTADLAHWQGDDADPAWRTYVADLRRAVAREEPATTASSAPTTTAAPQPPSSRRRPSARGVMAGVLVAVLATAAIVAVVKRASRDDHVAPAAAATSLPIPIAVLPFADLSPERNQQYLSDGLAEEILNQLAQIGSLDVRSRTSSFAFRGKNEDVRIIGQKLDASYLLEGSVRKSGDQLRITTQLIRVGDASQLWSKTYDERLSDIFTVQEKVARDVATALKVRLDVGDLSRAAGGTTNVTAYEKFLQARLASARIDGGGNELAVQLLREAVELDADFGAAWVSLAQSLYDLGGFAAQPAAVAAEIADIVARNVRSAPDAPWTQHLLAYDHLAHHRWAEADRATAAVVATAYGSRKVVDPWANPAIYLKWARFFSVGRVAEAFRLTDEWVRTDPLSLYASTVKIGLLDYVGRGMDVRAEYERSKTLEGSHSGADVRMLLHMMASGDASAAAIRAQFAIVAAGAPENSLARRLFERFDDPPAARAQLRAAFDDPANARNLMLLARYADGFGDRELTLQIVRKAVAEPVWRTPFEHAYILWFPYRSQLRGDPRFKALLREIGLVDYWRSTGNWGDFCKPITADDFECQ